MTLKKLPTFVDVFAGTASVAASVVTDGCPPPIVNDYDPILVCFAWAFTYYQRELRKRIAKFHNDMMEENIKSTHRSYDADDYKSHYERIDPRNLLTTPKVWDDPMTRWRLMEFFWLFRRRYSRWKGARPAPSRVSHSNPQQLQRCQKLFGVT